MTAPARTRSEPGTSIVAAQDAAVGVLPVAVQQQLELRKLSNQVAGKLAEQNWGAKLDLATRRAVADWGQRFRVDVTTEIHVLGGNVYLNANFWLRQLAELIETGVVEYAYADHVEDDPRLVKLGPDGEGEISRRLRERIMHQVPDKAASAVVFRVKLRAMAREVVGVKWCGNGTRTNDPVGDAKPVETSETRAVRRAMRLLASHVPREIAERVEELEQIEHTAGALTKRITEARATFVTQEAALHRDPQLPPAVSADDPYVADVSGGRQAKEVAGVPAKPITADTLATAAHAASQPDPYEAPTPFDDDDRDDLRFLD